MSAELGWLSGAFVVVDLGVALGLAVAVPWLRASGRMAPTVAALFWLGALIGCAWEVPFYLWGPEFAHMLHASPAEGPQRPLLHAFWDGGLFLVGVALCVALLGPGRFRAFSLAELGVLTAWAQAQALGIELLCNGRLWVYVPQPANPAWLVWGDVSYTVAPHLAWLVAPPVFYAGALALAGRLGPVDAVVGRP